MEHEFLARVDALDVLRVRNLALDEERLGLGPRGGDHFALERLRGGGHADDAGGAGAVGRARRGGGEGEGGKLRGRRRRGEHGFRTSRVRVCRRRCVRAARFGRMGGDATGGCEGVSSVLFAHMRFFRVRKSMVYKSSKRGLGRNFSVSCLHIDWCSMCRR